jgi:transcriptional regulator with XRE-family HTH domain
MQMKPRKHKHNLARLRAYLNLRQKEMGGLVGYSMRAIQSVENRTLTLSEELAQRISAATGIAREWLLENNLKAPLKADDFRPFTKKYYHQRRSDRERGLAPIGTVGRELRTLAFYSWMRAIFATSDGNIALSKTEKFLERLSRRYGHNRSILPASKLEGALHDFAVLRQHADLGATFITEKFKDELESVRRGVIIYGRIVSDSRRKQ